MRGGHNSSNGSSSNNSNTNSNSNTSQNAPHRHSTSSRRRRRASDDALTPDDDEDESNNNNNKGISENALQEPPVSGRRRSSASKSQKSNISKDSEMDLNISPEPMRERALRRRSQGNTSLSVSSEFLQLSHSESILGYDESYPPPPGEYEDEDEDDDAMELVVETLTGDSYRVRVSPWDTAAGLKSLLYRTQGILPNQQHLLLGQNELADDVCLLEQGVIEGATLRLVVAMRGGPINARRMQSQEDVLWREVTDYMDVNRDELWEGIPGGRTVTLLVLRDGENVNLYRVVENEDGTFSPLNQSWGSITSMRDGNLIDEATVTAQAEQDARTRDKMSSMKAQLADQRRKKKNRMRGKFKIDGGHTGKNNTAKLSVAHSIENLNQLVDLHKLQDSRFCRNLSRPTTQQHQKHQRQRGGSDDIRLPSVGGHGASKVWGVPRSRPSTQERSVDLRRNSLSRGSILNELPTLPKPVPVNFNRLKPLEGIRQNGDRNRLGRVEEEKGKGRSKSPFRPISAYRKSLVKHGKDNDSASEENPEISEDWPQREHAPMPLYMPDIDQQPRRRAVDPLHSSYNHQMLSVIKPGPERPKTSPEVLERRPPSTGVHSTISERIHLRAPDNRLRDMCNILGNSRGNSRMSLLSSNSPPDINQSLNLSQVMNSSNGVTNQRTRNNSISISVSSLRSRGTTPPSPGPGALVTTGSKEQRDILREIMRGSVITSRRSTPDKKSRRPGSGRSVTSPSYFPPVTPKRNKGTRRNRRPRCQQCSKRLGLSTIYHCRCGLSYCAEHRYPETHPCTFDYKAEGRKFLEMANPLVAPHKLPKI